MDASGHIDEEISLDKLEYSLLQRMNKLRKENPEGSFCDASFNIKGKEFHCHKFVLVSASSYFETMFNGNYQESTSCFNITLIDVDAEALDEILTAIYTARFHLNRHNAYFVLRASHMLLLTEIFEVTADYILRNTDIDYLIETCVFARQLGNDDVYNKCIESIASDLDDLSQTDAFAEKMTFDIFKEILSHDNIIKNKISLFKIVKKFCSFRKCTEDQVHVLLNCVNIKHDYFNRQMMLEYIMYSYLESRENVLATGSSVTDSKYNVCLNTVNIKTGAKGWGIWQSKHGFDDFEIICQVDSNAGFRKVEEIGNKNYCFEYDVKLGRNFFYYVQNDEKTFLNLPSSEHSKNSCFDIKALGNLIYLITEFGELFSYNCETGDWTSLSRVNRNISEPHKFNYYDSYYGTTKTDLINSTPKLVTYGNILYIVDDWNVARISPNEATSNHVSGQNKLGYLNRNSAVCCYRNQLIISGGLNLYAELINEVFSYDLVADKWLKLEDMNMGRANHSLTCDDTFLYAIENKAMLNEKYDFESKKWISIQSLPQRLRITNNETHFDLATGDLFNCSIK